MCDWRDGMQEGSGMCGKKHHAASGNHCACPPGTCELSASIIIPFRTRRDLLELCIRSLFAQTYPADLMEVVVVDDDNDEPIERIADIGGNVVSTRIVRCPGRECYRISTLRNVGLEAARGDVALFIDQDIICPPHFVESHMQPFHRSSKVVGVGLRRFVDLADLPHGAEPSYSVCSLLPDIASISNTTGTRVDRRTPELASFALHPCPANCVHGCNVSVSRDVALRVGGFDRSFDGAFGYEDIEFGYRLWRHGCSVVFVEDATVLHVENSLIDASERRATSTQNRKLLYAIAPELRAFREGGRDRWLSIIEGRQVPQTSSILTASHKGGEQRRPRAGGVQ